MALVPGNFTVREVSGEDLRKISIDNLVYTIYNNFIELAKYPDLKHNPSEIKRLLTSSNMLAFFLYNGHKLFGYAITELMRLNDGRFVLYISYLYIAKKYRKHGFGSNLLKQAINKAKAFRTDAVILTCDTQNENVINFYMMHGFMYDPYLRKHNRHDIFSLNY